MNISSDKSDNLSDYLDIGLKNYIAKRNSFLRESYLNKYEDEDFGFSAIDNGNIVGGIFGEIRFTRNWVCIDMLFVEEEYRGRGIATELIKKTEKLSRKHNMTGIWVDTWDFQAKPFYEKMGFTCFSELKDFPPNATLYYMSKVL